MRKREEVVPFPENPPTEPSPHLRPPVSKDPMKARPGLGSVSRVRTCPVLPGPSNEMLPQSHHPGSPIIPSLLPQLPIGAALTQPSPAPLHQLLPLPTLPPSPGHPPESPPEFTALLLSPSLPPNLCWAQGTMVTQSQPCPWVLPDTDK